MIVTTPEPLSVPLPSVSVAIVDAPFTVSVPPEIVRPFVQVMLFTASEPVL